MELKAAFTSPMLYIFTGLITLLVFGAVASDNVTIGGAVGNVYKNAPYTLTNFTLVLGIFGILFAAAFFNNAALRDFNNNFHEILFHLPIQKQDYFWGRFLGAWLLSTIPMLGIFPGAWLGATIGLLAGWVEADRIGPFYFETIWTNYLYFILPNMFFAGAIIFFLAHRFRNTIISFVGALAVIVAYFISGTLVSDIENEELAAIVDVFAIRTYGVYSRYFTPAERNTLSPSLEGIVLYNRLLWIGVGALISAISYALFSFRQNASPGKATPEEANVPKAAARPTVVPSFGASLHVQQFLSFFKANFLSITKSVVFKIVALFGILLLVVDLVEGYELFGLQSYPVTYRIIESIESSTGLFMTIVVVFFSGELVWRDRMSHIHEVVNATPHSSFVSIFAKVLSLVSVAVVLQVIFVVMGVASQLLRGYTAVEIDVYVIHFLIDTLPGYVIFAAMFVFIQTLVSNRYVGYFIGILFVTVWSIVLRVWYWESNMLIPGGTPSITYSDMNGFGPGLEGALWFNAYWLLFSVLLICLAGFLWPRSVVAGFREKWKVASANFYGAPRTFFFAVLVAWVAVASVLYYNTLVLNSYKSGKELELASVHYEQKYKKYENHPLPSVHSVVYHIDLWPEKRHIYVKADVWMLNKKDVAIDTLIFTLDDDWNTEITLDGEPVFDDSELGFRMYRLHSALQPGDSMLVRFATSRLPKGFANSVGSTSVVANGSFVNNMEILPMLGYSSNYELSDKNDRKKYGLPPKDRMPRLTHHCGSLCMRNYLTDGLADWVMVECTISTAPDQIAIAPGSLLREWSENGRKYFHYKLDTPSQNFYSFMSARYEVAREKHGNIDIEVYYHPAHSVNVPRMINAVKRSFAYYETHFGPYYHKQARIIEFPRYGSFAQAFPGTMPYSESIGFIINLENENENNIVDAVIAHEMAHQWWAHQEIPALMQGGTMLTESFAEYSSLMVMKSDPKSNDMKMKNFLKYDFDRYLRGRTVEREKEVPLYRVEEQDYIHYGKGSVIMYALQDYLSADTVNASLRRFLERYRYAEPPYPTSLDYLSYLEPSIPDSLRPMATDWIKHITLYDLRLLDASAVKTENGMYEVTLEVEAHKFYADSIGNESPAPLHDWVDIGLYNNSDEKRLSGRKRVKLEGEKARYTILTDSLPAKAAVDPRRMLIERVITDNSKSVSQKW